MDKNEENILHVVNENVAVPEVVVGDADIPDEKDSDENIDFSGAIPTIHIKKS